MPILRCQSVKHWHVETATLSFSSHVARLPQECLTCWTTLQRHNVSFVNHCLSLLCTVQGLLFEIEAMNQNLLCLVWSRTCNAQSNAEATRAKGWQKLVIEASEFSQKFTQICLCVLEDAHPLWCAVVCLQMGRKLMQCVTCGVQL